MAEIDIFKARACKYYVDGVCMLHGDDCAIWKSEGAFIEPIECKDVEDGDK